MNKQLLQLLQEKNPELAQVLALMEQQQGETNQEDDILKALKRERFKRKKMQSKLNALIEEINMMDTLLDELAGSLGACSSCWGSDDTCTYCEGAGKPGAFPPDKRLFESYILPVLTNTPWLKQLLIKQLQN